MKKGWNGYVKEERKGYVKAGLFMKEELYEGSKGYMQEIRKEVKEEERKQKGYRSKTQKGKRKEEKEGRKANEGETETTKRDGWRKKGERIAMFHLSSSPPPPPSSPP
jgi:hypothetical protein